MESNTREILSVYTWGVKSMKSRNNFDEALWVLTAHKILLAASVIICAIVIGFDWLRGTILSVQLGSIVFIAEPILFMPMIFGLIKMIQSAYRNESISLLQLFEFYKASRIVKALFYSTMVYGMYLCVIFFCAIMLIVFPGDMMSLLGLIIGAILIVIYWIKIIPVIFLFVGAPVERVRHTVMNGWSMTKGWMKDLLLISWGIFWRALLLQVIPAAALFMFGENSHIGLILNMVLMMIIMTYAIAVAVSVWQELSEEADSVDH